MEEIIYKIDNWSIIKLLGGITIILTAIIGFFSKFLLTRLSQSHQQKIDEKIESLKGEIYKENSILKLMIENHLSTSQKILEKKIQAYDLLWKTILEIKENLPSGINLFHQIITDSEIKSENAFNFINDNQLLGPLLKSYEPKIEMLGFINNRNNILSNKPYYGDLTYKLYFTFNALLARVTNQFISEYQQKRIYNWKKDKQLKSVLEVTVTKKELEYLNELQVGSLIALINLIEYKLVEDYRENLNIKNKNSDTIEYIKEIEKLLKVK